MTVKNLIDIADFNPGPVIGISGQAHASPSVIAMVTQVRAMGGKAVFLDHTDPATAKEDLGKIDALIVMGNDYDIDPKEYGAEKNPNTHILPENDPAKADDVLKRGQYENALIEGALQKKMPLLGVCGGMQRINVRLGGSLHQHLPDMLGNNSYDQSKAGIAPYVPVHYIGIRPGSELSHISEGAKGVFAPRFEDDMPPEIVKENAFHHQSVKKLGTGLAVGAISEDGVVESVEADPEGPFKDQFLLGVQFHPEFSASKLGPHIASTLVQQAMQYATDHPKKQVANASWVGYVSSRPSQQVER